MEDFPENWIDFKCAARQSLEECIKDSNKNLKKAVMLAEKLDYLNVLCKWIEEEEIRIVRENT